MKYYQQDGGIIYLRRTWTSSSSAPSSDRSSSRGRTHMDLENPNDVSEWDIGLPIQLDDRRRDSTWSEEFL
jgi:hypothetical protein